MTRNRQMKALMKQLNRLDQSTQRDADQTEHAGSQPIERMRRESGRVPELDGLVVAAQSGDRDALQALLKRILPSVRNLVRLLCGNDRHVDDFSQEALVVIVQRIASFEGRSSFRTWVYGVTLRVVRGRMRNQWFQRSVFKVDLEEVRSEDNPHKTFERRRQLAKILDHLPAKQREVLVMHHALEMTLPEIGAALDVSVETARSRLRLAKKRLEALGIVNEGAV